MQKRPVTIALAIAGIIAGTHAGIAAISTETSERSVTAAPMQTETQATADTQAPAAVEVQAVAEAPAAAPATTAAATAPAAQSDERYVRIPFTNYRVKVTNPTFPSAAMDTPDPLPSVVAYFDRRNANTTLAGAPGPVFPSAASEGLEPLPATLAYFDQMEARRIAASKPAAPVASTAAAEATPTAAMDLPPGNLVSGLREPATVRPGT